jgi:hypothetical protein
MSPVTWHMLTTLPPRPRPFSCPLRRHQLCTGHHQPLLAVPALLRPRHARPRRRRAAGGVLDPEQCRGALCSPTPQPGRAPGNLGPRCLGWSPEATGRRVGGACGRGSHGRQRWWGSKAGDDGQQPGRRRGWRRRWRRRGSSRRVRWRCVSAPHLCTSLPACLALPTHTRLMSACMYVSA